MRRLVIAAALVAGAVVALLLFVGIMFTARSQGSQDQEQRFLQWEQCELNSSGWGRAGDPCGPMPVP